MNTFEEDLQSKQLDAKIVELYNKKVSECEILKATGVKQLFVGQHRLVDFIGIWTSPFLFNPKKIRRAYKFAVGNPYVKSVHKEGDIYKIVTTNDKEMEICKASKLFPILKKIKHNEIETSRRAHQCTESITVALIFRHECKVVTGYVYGLSEKSKYVHTWVELGANGKEFVLDYTLNALINKEGYYDFNRVEVLSEITYTQLKADCDIIKERNIKVDDREYLLDRNAFLKKYCNDSKFTK